MNSETPLLVGHPWYVCQTKPRQEALAVHKLEEQGYEVFLPMLVAWKIKKGSQSRTWQVMFPRYCFVRCGRDSQSIAPIRSTPGVTGLVTFGNTPATLSANIVEAIRHLAAQISDCEQLHPFAVGEQVSIVDGPLKGLAGIVSELAQERVVVMINLLGREKPVALPTQHLEQTK